MKRIGIELETGASMAAAITDCAKSIAEGYGAGTLTDGEDGDWLGFWTSVDAIIDAWKYDLVIDIPEIMRGNQYLVAGAVYSKLKDYQ
jgi:hypothetical protein